MAKKPLKTPISDSTEPTDSTKTGPIEKKSSLKERKGFGTKEAGSKGGRGKKKKSPKLEMVVKRELAERREKRAIELFEEQDRGLQQSEKDDLISSGPGKDKFSHDCELLMFEWILNAPMTGPANWLQSQKGYSAEQSYHIIQATGGHVEWQVQRNKMLDKIQQTVVDRHISIIEEVERSNVAASKLTTARAMKMLSEGGFKRRGKDGDEWLQPLNPQDILNVAAAVEKAQTIYRRAIGLDSMGGDINKLVGRLEELKNNPASNININIQNNTQNNIVQTDVAKQSELTQKAEETVKVISYEAVKEFIAYRKELKAKAHLLGKQVVGTEIVDVSDEEEAKSN